MATAIGATASQAADAVATGAAVTQSSVAEAAAPGAISRGSSGWELSRSFYFRNEKQASPSPFISQQKGK